MKKLIRTLLPALLMLAAAAGINARDGMKAVEASEPSSAEQVAKTNPTGFIAPRGKSGSAAAMSSYRIQGTSVPLVRPTQMARAEYIPYVPDLIGMSFGSPTTNLQKIAQDGTLTTIPGLSLATNMGIPGGGYGHDGQYFLTIQYAYPYMNIFYVFGYDTETWQMLPGWPYQGSQKFMSTDLTYDVTDDKVYGCFTNEAGDGYEFGVVNFTEGERTTISALPGAWNAIAADSEGQIYAIDMEGNLLKVDKTNGSTTKVGEGTGFVPKNVSSATFDHKSGKLYWSVSTDTDGFLCEVNTETGVATKIADFPDAAELYALYVIPPAAEDRAPAAPTNLRLNFTGGSLSGTLTFDAPETLFRGEDGVGGMEYSVLVGNATVATGSVDYGQKDVRTPEFSVNAPGQYTIKLICTNEEGDSPKAEISQFIGADAPAGVTGAKAEYADGVFTVTWNAPATSANGGYVNPDEILYTVTRMPDNVVVAEKIKQTTVTDPVAEPESFVKYKYSITAEYDGYKSMAVNTNGVGLGNFIPPFTEDFSDMNYLESYTTVDANNDGRCWGAFIGMAQGLGPVYGSENSTADDWLITPAIKLEGGKFYKLGLDAATMGASWTETFEVALGDAPTAEAMTRIVIPTSSVNTAGFSTTMPFEEYFSVPSDGIYYLGIHYNTAEGAYMLLCDNLTVSEPIDAMSPGQVTELAVTPAEDGSKVAHFSFKAPAVDLQGEPLPFLDRVEIMMDDQLLHTVQPVEPGQQVEIDLNIPKSGKHKFTVTAYNGQTAGRPAETEVHVGLDVPKAPANANVALADDQYTVTVTWEASTEDINGKPIPASDITYMIVRLNNGQQVQVASNISGTSHTFKAAASADADQEFYQYAVFAQNETGFSTGNVTQMLAIGAPDKMPWVESFADGMMEHIMAAHPLGETDGSWMAFGDQSFSMGVKSYDADNGMIGMYGPTVGDKARLFSGRIDFSTLEHPTLSFYTFNLQSSETGAHDLNEITVLVDNGNGLGFVPVKTLVVDEIAGGVRGWAKATVDLTDFAGQTVQIAFDAETKVYLYTLIDLMEITDRKNVDLAVISASAPKSVALDEKFEVPVTVENLGRLDVDSYVLTLLNNGKTIAEISAPALASGASARHTFQAALNASDSEMNALQVALVLSADENSANDRSGEMKVRLRNEAFPAVVSLSATDGKDAPVVLSWEEPALSNLSSQPLTESFEDADTDDTFPTDFGNWTFRDEDKGYIGGMRGLELPGIQTGSQQSFWVMDADHPVFNGNTTYKANTGSKYLAQMYTMNLQSTGSVACDDWAISPWLNEKKQTISFYAQSYGGEDTNERFQVLYSTTGTLPEDFTLIETVPAVPHEWTRYEYTLPEGARYFAIRCTSIFEFMLFIDDVTYTPAGAANMQLVGYNVYVDGERQNAEPLTARTYSYNGVKSADPNTLYSVSAVYTRGESRAVSVHAGESGIESVAALSTVYGGRGFIAITAENADVTVWSIDGVQKAHTNVRGNLNIPAAPGAYLVSCNGRTHKVMVR